MKKLLFVDACPRGETSRSLRLARHFLSTVQKNDPDFEPKILCLNDLDLQPLDAADTARRDALVKSGAFSDPFLALAREFAEADAVVIAAPFWDMSFPSMLRVYLERLFVIGLTFHYDECGRTVGDCAPAHMVYVTTRGGYVTPATPDFAVPYLKATCATLGVPRFDCLVAEGLDIVGNDAGARLCAAEAEAERLAVNF